MHVQVISLSSRMWIFELCLGGFTLRDFKPEAEVTRALWLFSLVSIDRPQLSAELVDLALISNVSRNGLYDICMDDSRHLK